MQPRRHDNFSIKPLLHSNSVTVGRQKRLYCVIGVAVLECKSGSLTMSSGLFLLLIHYIISHKRTQLTEKQAINTNRSKLEIFAQRISLCAERGVLSIRNANIVTDDIIANKQTGIYHFKSRKDQKKAETVKVSAYYISSYCCPVKLFQTK
ncbi:hypothetical protein [Prevotella sp.]|uniref:hypothetical protein n=1 Tax=Prevotella sp. TaxID=59823 RepID=UPI0025FE1BE9|nr:hypothetical protein [Prevotella sp.]